MGWRGVGDGWAKTEEGRESIANQGNGDLERGFGHGRQTLSSMRKTNQLGIVSLMVNARQLGMAGYVV